MITKDSKVIDHTIRIDIHVEKGDISLYEVLPQQAINSLGKKMARLYGVIPTGKVTVKKITS